MNATTSGPGWDDRRYRCSCRRAGARVAAAMLILAATSLSAWAASLQEVTGFGSNPGQLKMYRYVPDHPPSPMPLVVALHGCGETAAVYGEAAGWITMADRLGFALVLPEQQDSNHPLKCFNFSKPEDSRRDSGEAKSGEAKSIAEMVAKTKADLPIDDNRIFVAGLSAGGGMTAVMLATYPDIFAAGGVIAGVAYRCSPTEYQTTYLCGVDVSGQGNWPNQTQPVTPRSAEERGRAVLDGNVPHPKGWPRVSIWWGTADGTVHPDNAVELIKQWTFVHGIDQTPDRQDEVHGYPHAVYTDAQGTVWVETYKITGMGHGQPIDPGQAQEQCGTPAPYILDVNICAAHDLARFWGLDQMRAEVTITTPGNGAEVKGTVPVTVRIGSARADTAGTYTVKLFIDDAERWSGAAETQPGQPWEGHWDWNAAAEFNGPHTLRASAADAAGHSGDSTPVRVTVKDGIPVPPDEGFNETFSGRLGGGALYDNPGWNTDGWAPANDNHTAGSAGSRSAHASVVSGHDCKTGPVTRSLSRRIALPDNPQLSYARKVTLDAMPNVLTRAEFKVLADGSSVDESVAAGGRSQDPAWTERTVDLSRFANKTVELAFQVTANSNVCMDVTAEAWVDDIRVKSQPAAYRPQPYQW